MKPTVAGKTGHAPPAYDSQKALWFVFITGRGSTGVSNGLILTFAAVNLSVGK